MSESSKKAYWEAEAQRLELVTDDNLYLEMGEHLSGKPALPPPPGRLIYMAKDWFSSKSQDIAKFVCADGRVKAISRQDVKTHEVIVAVCGALDAGSHMLGSVP